MPDDCNFLRAVRIAPDGTVRPYRADEDTTDPIGYITHIANFNTAADLDLNVTIPPSNLPHTNPTRKD